VLDFPELFMTWPCWAYISCTGGLLELIVHLVNTLTSFSKQSATCSIGGFLLTSLQTCLRPYCLEDCALKNVLFQCYGMDVISGR
jgi:hypothetical protein